MRWRSLLLLLSVSLLTAGCALPGVSDDGYTPPGGLAYDLLRATPYAKIHIDLRVENGATLDETGITDARTVLTQALGKNVAVAKAGSFNGKGENGVYNLDDLVRLEAEHRTAPFDGGDTAVIHALALAGRYTDEQVLALAYGGSSLAFFAGRINGISGDNGCSILVVNPCGAPERRYVTRSVFVHEVGHLLGLVNHGIPMVRPHEDPESPGHSRNQESVMYKGVTTYRDVGRYLQTGGDIPYRFDEDDLADLRAAAGR